MTTPCVDTVKCREFFSAALGVTVPNTSTFMAFTDHAGIVGGWVFDRYTGVGGSVHAHWAGRERGWLTNKMLKLAAAYIFTQLGCTRVYGEVEAKNTYVRRIDKRLGFEQIAVLPGYFPNDDLVLYELTKARCRWAPPT